ncbi:MAG: allantoinase, partial [Eubacteriales bacterium]
MNKEQYDLIIRNGKIVNEDGVSNADIAVKDGKIVEITEKISAEKKASKEIDAKGLHVLPGLIDAHVHFNEPGS